MGFLEALEAITAQPIGALIAGVVLLIFPRLLSYAVAAYLIVVGVVGIWPDLLS